MVRFLATMGTQYRYTGFEMRAVEHIETSVAEERRSGRVDTGGDESFETRPAEVSREERQRQIEATDGFEI